MLTYLDAGDKKKYFSAIKLLGFWKIRIAKTRFFGIFNFWKLRFCKTELIPFSKDWTKMLTSLNAGDK